LQDLYTENITEIGKKTQINRYTPTWIIRVWILPNWPIHSTKSQWKPQQRPAMVAHTCSPSCSGGGNQEYHDSRPTLTKSEEPHPPSPSISQVW
jgi:hypothetical protein